MESRPELGPQLQVYKNRGWPARFLMTLILPGVLFVLAPLAYGIYRSNFDYTHFGPASVQRWSSTWILFSLIGLFLFLMILVLWFPRSILSVAVHKEGLDLAFPKRKSIRWEKIAGISNEAVSENFLGFPIRTRHHAILYPAIGKPVKLDGLENLPELVTQLKAHLYPCIFPSLEKQFQSGQWLHFGPIAIQLDILNMKGRQVPWSQVRSLAVRSGDLVVEFENQVSIRQPTGAIPNLELLIQLIQKYV